VDQYNIKNKLIAQLFPCSKMPELSYKLQSSHVLFFYFWGNFSVGERNVTVYFAYKSETQ
jgi:hypothetical protein